MAQANADAVGLTKWNDVPPVAFQSYFGGFFQALAHAIPDPRQGMTREAFLAWFKGESVD
jgi:hypothetical protein